MVIRCTLPVFGDRLFDDRLAGHRQPLLPFLGAGGRVVGVEEEPAAGCASTVLRFELAHAAAIERWFGPRRAAPFGPVPGEGRVVYRRLALHQIMADDLRPGEPEEVAATFTVAKHPTVPSGRVELAEVPIDDPALRLARMAEGRPLVAQLPEMTVQILGSTDISVGALTTP